MFRIDGPGNLAGHFSDGNPFTTPPTDGTIVTGDWLEHVQEELAGVIEATGRTLDKANKAQLLAAIRDLVGIGSQRKRMVYAGIKTGATTLDVLGTTAPTITGTPSAVVTVRGPFLSIDTIDTATDRDAGVAGPFDAAQRRWDPDYTFQIDTNTMSDSRLWVGLFSASPMALSNPTSISCAGFRYENQVDTGATFRTVTSDGVSSTVKNSIVVAAVNTKYEFRIRHVGGGRFEFLCNGALVNAHDLALGDIVPGVSTSLGPVAMLRHSVASGVLKTIRFGFWGG